MMRKVCIALALVVISMGVQAQNYAKKLGKAPAIAVLYQSVYKGKVSPGGVTMLVKGQQVKMGDFDVSKPDVVEPGALVQRSYMDYKNLCSFKRATLPNGEVISCASPIVLGKDFKEIGEETLLGLHCKKVRTVLRSNTIDVWYTTDLPFRGTPQPGVGVPDGLVLKIVRNGDMVQEATTLLRYNGNESLLPEDWGQMLEPDNYQYAINQSGVISVPVFDQQTVCFNGAKLSGELKEGVVYPAAGGSVILKKVKLPTQIADRAIFVEVVQYSDGDAYDRTGSVFVIPTGKEKSFIDALKDLKSVPAFHAAGKDFPALISTPTYDVPVELMRFFTGFGVRKYNHVKVPGQTWADSVIYKTEVTALASQLQGEVWIGAYIGNWDAKGHRVSLKLKYYPNDWQQPIKALPLFNTVNYIEQAGQDYPTFMGGDSLRVTFTLKEDAKHARLYYLTTGHGGWGGGDEFNQKVNTVYVDGKQVIRFIPWRDDCGTYRNWNPCSGNFSNGLSSSDLSRSNWCPGTVTNPEYIYIGDLKAGEHTVTVQIPQGKPEGSSISYWCISGTLLYTTQTE